MGSVGGDDDFGRRNLRMSTIGWGDVEEGAQAMHSEWERVKIGTDPRPPQFQYDVDNNGRIDTSELLLAFRDMGAVLTKEQAADVLEMMDVDHSGEIDKGEFVAAMELAEIRLMQQSDDESYELTVEDDRW